MYFERFLISVMLVIHPQITLKKISIPKFILPKTVNCIFFIRIFVLLV